MTFVADRSAGTILPVQDHIRVVVAHWLRNLPPELVGGIVQRSEFVRSALHVRAVAEALADVLERLEDVT